MLIDFLAGLVLGLVEPLLSALPVFDVVAALPDPTELYRYLSVVDYWVPIKAPLGLLVDVLKLGAFFVPVALFVWLWRLIPGKAT